jgi:hypothetical protein
MKTSRRAPMSRNSITVAAGCGLALESLGMMAQ